MNEEQIRQLIADILSRTKVKHWTGTEEQRDLNTVDRELCLTVGDDVFLALKLNDNVYQFPDVTTIQELINQIAVDVKVKVNSNDTTAGFLAEKLTGTAVNLINDNGNLRLEINEQDLSSYVTETELNTVLSAYSTTTEINQVLANYVTETTFNTAISNLDSSKQDNLPNGTSTSQYLWWNGTDWEPKEINTDIPNHNDTINIQGGTTSERYHIDLAGYNSVNLLKEKFFVITDKASFLSALAYPAVSKVGVFVGSNSTIELGTGGNEEIPTFGDAIRILTAYVNFNIVGNLNFPKVAGSNANRRLMIDGICEFSTPDTTTKTIDCIGGQQFWLSRISAKTDNNCPYIKFINMNDGDGLRFEDEANEYTPKGDKFDPSGSKFKRNMWKSPNYVEIKEGAGLSISEVLNYDTLNGSAEKTVREITISSSDIIYSQTVSNIIGNTAYLFFRNNSLPKISELICEFKLAVSTASNGNFIFWCSIVIDGELENPRLAKLNILGTDFNDLSALKLIKRNNSGVTNIGVEAIASKFPSSITSLLCQEVSIRSRTKQSLDGLYFGHNSVGGTEEYLYTYSDDGAFVNVDSLEKLKIELESPNTVHIICTKTIEITSPITITLGNNKYIYGEEINDIGGLVLNGFNIDFYNELFSSLSLNGTTNLRIKRFSITSYSGSGNIIYEKSNNPLIGTKQYWDNTYVPEAVVGSPLAPYKSTFELLLTDSDIAGADIGAGEVVATELEISVSTKFSTAKVYYTGSAGSGALNVVIYEATNNANQLVLTAVQQFNINTATYGYNVANAVAEATLDPSKRYFIGLKKTTLNATLAGKTIATTLKNQNSSPNGYAMSLVNFTPTNGVNPDNPLTSQSFQRNKFPHIILE